MQGARVDATTTETGVKFSTVSNGSGAYHLLGLPTGPYLITVSKVGFKRFESSGLVLRIGDNLKGNAR